VQAMTAHEARRLYRQANQLYREQQFDKALRVLRYVDEYRPNSTDVAKGIIACCQQLGLVQEEAEARQKLDRLTGGDTEQVVAFTTVDDLLGPLQKSSSSGSRDRGRHSGSDYRRWLPVAAGVALLVAVVVGWLVWQQA